MRLRTALALCLTALTCTTLSARAAPDDGVQWLLSNQNEDGSFGSIPWRDTGPTLEALKLQDVTLTDATLQAASWLYYLEPIQVDVLSRRARGLVTLGEDPEADLLALAAARNADGSWGFESGWLGGLPETTQVLLALAESGSSDLATVSAALTYVTALQGTDGGFTWLEGGTSDPLLTAEVLSALAAWQDVFSLQTAITKATTYLFSQQQSSGLIGTSHAVLATALTLEATLLVSVDTTAWGKAYNALSAAQKSDGSWEDDAYTTAKAIMGLASGRPDLSILSVAPGSSPVVDGVSNTIVVQIKNEGRAALAETVPLSLTWKSASGSSTKNLGSKDLSTLAAGATTTLTLAWDTAGQAGGGYLTAVVDAANLLKEVDRQDNTRIASVSVLGGADFATDERYAQLQPSNPTPADSVTFYSRVVSYSALSQTGIAVSLHDGDPLGGGTLLKQWTLDLGAGGTADIDWTGKLAEGSHLLYLTVDPADVLDETDETNNQAITEVVVAPRVDLQVSTGLVAVSPANVAAGTSATLSVTVFNGDKDAVGPFKVGGSMLDPAVSSSRVSLGQVSVTGLASGASTTVTLSVPTTGHLGSVTLYGTADPDAKVVETSETNNEASATLNILKSPNLSIASAGFAPPASIQQGATVGLTATVDNPGGSTLKNVPVAFYLNSTSGSALGQVTVLQINAGSSAVTPPFSWNTTGLAAGSYTLYAVVDPANAFAETDESDNQTSKTTSIAGRADLVVSSALSGSPSSPVQGDTLVLSATVKNGGTADISQAFTVAFYDGPPASGGVLLGTSSISSLAAGATQAVSFNYSTLGKAGAHTFYLLLDTANAIVEADETNNQSGFSVSISSGTTSLTPPTNLAASIVGDNVTLTWTPSGSPAGYKVYRGGQTINPPNTSANLVTGSTLTASTTVTGYPASNASDGSTATWWEGVATSSSWTYEVDFGSLKDVAAYTVTWYSKGNMSFAYAFQTWSNGQWVTRDSGQNTLPNAGNTAANATLKRVVSTSKVRLYLTPLPGYTQQMAISELTVQPVGLVTAATLLDRNAAAGATVYEVRAADGTGKEGEAAALSYTVGDVTGPSNPVATAYSNRTEVTYTASTSSTVRGYQLVRDEGRPVLGTASVGGLSAYSSNQQSGWEAYNAVDGNEYTSWLTSYGSAPWTIEFTLPSKKRISNISILWVPNYHGIDYDFYGWTGTTWILEESVRGNAYGSRGHAFTQFGATDKVRLVITKSAKGTYVAITEFTITEGVPVTGTTITDSSRPPFPPSYRVAALSDAHASFDPSELVVPPAGQEPPAAPATLSVSSYTRSDISLTWGAVSGVAGYHVYDYATNTRLTTTPVTGTTYTHLGAINPAVTSYSYAVSSVNSSGVEGGKKTVVWSPPLPATLTLAGTADASSVNLSWTAASEPLRTGFRIYMDGAAYGETLTSPFVDQNAPSGSHGYQVVGVDIFGREGTKSNTVTLSQIRTDLAVLSTDIFITPDAPTALDTATLTAFVYNLGTAASAASELRFSDGDPASGGTLISKVTLPAVAGGGVQSVSVSWPLSGKAGTHKVYVDADPAGTIAEANESNNKSFITVTVASTPTYALTLGTIATSSFPNLTAPLTVKDDLGQPVTSLADRYLTVKEGVTAATGITLTATATPGVYTLGWTTPTPARDGTSRSVSVTLTLPKAGGSTVGTYVAPTGTVVDLAATGLVASPTAPTADSSFSLQATVKNQGSSTQSTIKVRFYKGTVSTSTALGDATISSLAATASGTASLSVTAVPGSTTYIAVVDPDSALTESNEGNNQASLSLEVPENPTPDLSVAATGMTVTPATPTSGDVATLSAVLQNLGGAVENVLVQAYLGDPRSGGKLIGQSQTVTSLAARSQTTINFSWNTAGISGSQTVYVFADPLNSVVELSETNNVASKAFTINKPVVTLTLTTDKATYAANSLVTISATVDPKGVSFKGSLNLEVQDANGKVMTTLSPVTVGPITASTKYTAQTSTGTYLAGSYKIAGTLLEGTLARTSGTASFTIQASSSLSSLLLADAATYLPFDSVTVEGSVTNASVNTNLASVGAVLTLLAPNGTTVVETASFGPSDLSMGQKIPVKAVWNLGDNAPGTYTLKLVGTSGTISTTTTKTFKLLSTAETGLGLTGDLGLSAAQVVPGASVVADYQIDNSGNSAVTGMPARVTLVGDADGKTYDTHTFTLTVNQGKLQTGLFDLKTSLAEGSYTSLLEVQISGQYQTLAYAALNLLSVKGTIAASPAKAQGGVDNLAVTYSLSNQSTVNLSNLELTIDVVSQSTGALVQSIPWLASPAAGKTVSSSDTLSTSSLGIGVYKLTLSLTPSSGSDILLAETTAEVIDSIKPTSGYTINGQYVEKDGLIYLPGSSRIVLSATDNFSGVAKILYTMDGVSGTYSQPIQLPSQGSHTFTYAAQDVAGNLEASRSLSFVRDDDPPVIAISGVTDGQCGDASVTPTIAVTDSSPTATLMLLDGQPYAGQTVTDLGPHELVVTATDILEQGSTSTVTFSIVSEACACLGEDGCTTPAPDLDNDGYSPGAGDCADLDPTRHPGAAEICNDVDDNCDGQVDEASECQATPTPEPTLPPDSDQDGWADGSDCDDLNPAVNPSAVELCNGIDDDCDGSIDEGKVCVEPTPTPEPTQADTPTPTQPPTATEAPTATATVAPTPEPTLEPTPRLDGDGDGWLATSDCDDTDPEVHPFALDSCNGKDDDCDGNTDENNVCLEPTPTLEPTETPTDPPTPTLTPTPTDVPVTDTPETDTPVTDTPETETPDTDTPETDTPATDTPATGTPTSPTPSDITPTPEESGTPVQPPLPGCTCDTGLQGEGSWLAGLGWVFGALWLRRRRQQAQQPRP